MTHTGIIPAHDIDYNDAEEICGYQLLLCKTYERAGGFDCFHRPTAELREVHGQGVIWLGKVKLLIERILSSPLPGRGTPTQSESSTSGLDLGAVPDLLGAYDLLHRVCRGIPCFDYLRRVKLQTADRWAKGDRTISDTDVALLLLSEAKRDIRTLGKRYASHAFQALGTWIEELSRYTRFPGITDTEAYKRLAYVLKDDLTAYVGTKGTQDTLKSAWVRTYTVEDVKPLDTPTLFRYIGFMTTASRWGYYNSEDEDELYCRLWSEYISRPKTNTHLRQALEIDLAKYATV